MGDFVALILTHGRAGNVKTDKTLRKCGYTGPIIYVIDDEDEQADDYMARYGVENVAVFTKSEYIEKSDTRMQKRLAKRGVILYARNAAFDIAKNRGYTWFIELDDDYTSFEHRYARNGKLGVQRITDLDTVFREMVAFVEKTGAMFSLSQGGDMVGGLNKHSGIGAGEHFKRKSMNSFVFNVDDPMRFSGAVNEDVVTYLREGRLGRVVCMTYDATLVQTQTQSTSGGMTGEYLDDGTFCKSMFAVVENPSCCQISKMRGRIHHKIEWRYAVPKIVREKYRK